MSRLKCVVLLLMLCGSGTAWSSTLTRPQLDVTYVGVNGANSEWQVTITPFSPPGSIAVELAFAIDGSTISSIDINATDWDFATPGNNPFGGVTSGLDVEPSNDRFFASFGSIVFPTGAPSRFLTLRTVGTGPTTLRYGLAASGLSMGGDITAEEGMLFRGYTGSVNNVPEPAAWVLGSLMLIGMAGLRRR